MAETSKPDSPGAAHREAPETPHLRPHDRTAHRRDNAATLEEIVRRVVEVAQPERIILFGSAARGESGPGSDIDLLVIKSGVEHRRRLAGEIYLNLRGIEVPVDIVVASPEDLERYGTSVGSVIRPALREGEEIYVA